MESFELPPESEQDIGQTVDDLLTRAGEVGLPPSETKVRLRIVGEKIVEKSIENKGVIIFALVLTAGGYLAHRRHRRRKREK